MDPIIGGSLISGIGSVLGGLFGGSSARKAQRRQNEFNLSLAREQWDRTEAESQRDREFQANMSNTAYQRAMADMRQAGLNPILAYGQGGASQPAGRGASHQAVAPTEFVDDAKAALAVNSAIEAIRQMRAQRKNLDEVNRNLQEQNKVYSATARKIDAETKNISDQNPNIRMRNTPGRIFNDSFGRIDWQSLPADAKYGLGIAGGHIARGFDAVGSSARSAWERLKEERRSYDRQRSGHDDEVLQVDIPFDRRSGRNQQQRRRR